MMTIGDLKKSLEGCDDNMWVCLDSGPATGVVVEVGANEPFVAIVGARRELPRASDWMTAAANEITSTHVQGGELHTRTEVAADVRRILERWSPVDRILRETEETEQTLAGLQAELGELRAKEPPLLQCVDCRNTESCAGAMARQFNHGRCVHCGGWFKVVRA